MPSVALQEWQTVRLPRLNELDAQAAASSAVVPPNPPLADENLRGYVVLLSAHFQGFCRDLYTEGVHAVLRSVPVPMHPLVQAQCLTGCALDRGNPDYEVLRKDFKRFGVDPTVVIAANPRTAAAVQVHITHLGHLNLWRNHVAHHSRTQPAHGGPLHLTTIRTWRDSCDALATELDRIVYDQLASATGTVPW